MALSPGFAQRPKILVLHGAFQSANEFQTNTVMLDLEEALPKFEFVYADGGVPLESKSFLWTPLFPSAIPLTIDRF